MATRRPELAFQDDTAFQGPNGQALLQAARQAGGRSVRINVLWNKVRQGHGYDLGAIDQEVNQARSMGLRPQLTLMGAPSYSTTGDQSLSFRNTNPALMKAFARDMAQHFRGRVGRYSIWNEPNWGGFISGADKDPVQAARRYRNLARAGIAGVKSADKGAQVLLGEMTAQPNAKKFLAAMLAGKPLQASGFAFHPYDSPGVKMRDGKNRSGTWDIDTLGDLQSTLDRYKRQGKLQTAAGKAAPLYLTEMGYLKSDVPNEQIRAQKMARAFRLAQAAGARQLLQYQVAPTQKPIVPGAPQVIDAYGNTTPGAGHEAPGWVWDTTVNPLTLAAAMRRPTAGVARARR